MSEPVPASEYSEEDLKMVRTFSSITVGGLALFLLLRVLGGRFQLLGVVPVSLAIALPGALALWKFRNYKVGAHLTLMAATIAVGASHIRDGVLDSASLWLIWMIPVSAGLLFGKKAILAYTGVSSLFICAAWFGPKLGVVYEEQVSPGVVEWIVLRMLTIITAGVVGVRIVRKTEASLLATAQRSLELLRTHEMAKAYDAKKSKFLGQMSHEIRTPMNGIKGMVQLWRREEKLDPAVRDSVDVMDRCADHLMSLVSDIQDLSKIDSGTIETLEQPFLVNAAVGDVILLFEAKALAKGLALRVQGPSQEIWVRGDRRRLIQVLSNLVGNAIKFTDKGEVCLAWNCDQEAWMSFRVVDQGIGMTQSQVECLFQKFAQVDLDEGVARGGTGLGLTISKALAEAMGGTLGVSSEAGVGSEFALSLPLPQVQAPKVQSPSVRNEVQGKSLRVLAVDDDPVSLLVLRLSLERMGCRVKAVAGSDDAIQAAQEEVFDLILMDLHMPGRDGVQTMQAIRCSSAEHRHTTVIAITASSDLDDTNRCIDAGMRDVIVKPVAYETLERTVRGCGDELGGKERAA